MASASALDASVASTTTETPDPVSGPISLYRAVRSRRAEYVRPHRMRVKIGTWNVAACPGTDKDLASWFVSGRGIEERLAGLELSRHPAIERQETSESLGKDPNIVRLVGGDKIDLYVLGLQEVVDLNRTSQYVTRYADQAPAMADKWKMALEAAMPSGYQLVSSEQLSGMLLLVYASPSLAPSISNVSSTSVGTGFLGLLGNKGAVATRLVLGETTKMVFVNCHLSSGSESSSLDRRIWDINQIVSRTQFAPISYAGVSEEDPDKLGSEDFAFWFGDLNFRLDGLPGEDIRHILTLHTQGEYGAGSTTTMPTLDGEGVIVMRSSESSDDQTVSDSASTRSTDKSASATDASEILPDPDDFVPDPAEDPTSLQATLDSLLPHDQLRRIMADRKAFQDGWREGPVTFLPSYKYDVGSVGLFDSSEKSRAPSWCDRILYRSKKDRENYERMVKDEEEARERDDDMKARGIDHAGDDESLLFDYDPDADGDEPAADDRPPLDYDEFDETDEHPGNVSVHPTDAFDGVHLEIYTSHQRIMSSDHKPVTSLFTIDYEAVVPELKAVVYADVARELDRAENEGRPGITVVVDQPTPAESNGAGPDDHPDVAVDLGEVRFLTRETASLTLANTGSVPATFSFVDKPTTDEMDCFNPRQWLTTSFVPSGWSEEDGDPAYLGTEITLEPGETVNALLSVFVDSLSYVRMLNDGQTRLEDVLVLRVTEGRDHFIPVCASWAPTCLGRSIDELIRVPEGGIRAFFESQSFAGSIPYDREVKWSAPKELFKLTEAVEILTERVLADEQMLQDFQLPRYMPGWPFEDPDPPGKLRPARIVAVLDVLDNDKPVGEAFDPETPAVERLETVSQALLLFLRALADGIVTIPTWARIEQATLPALAATASSSSPRLPPSNDPAADEEDKAVILDILSSTPNHNISFVFLTSTLAKVISELAPLSRADVDNIRKATAPPPTATSPTPSITGGAGGAIIGGIASLGRRSLNGIRSRSNTSGSGTAEAVLGAETTAALSRRALRERRVAEIFGKAVCRAPGVPAPSAGWMSAAEAATSSQQGKDKERRALEDRQRALLELFLRRSRQDATS